MTYRKLSLDECKKICPGEAITIASIMVMVLAAVMAVVIYRLFRAAKGTVTIPGGWKFDWKQLNTMPKMNEIPNIDQPREKAIRFGIQSLNDAELLAILIGVGSKDNNVLQLANSLLADSLTVFNLASKPYQYFTQFKGISEAKALKLCACFEIAKRYDRRQHILLEANSNIDSEFLFNRFYGKMAELNKEILVLVVLNRNKKIIYEKTLYKGTEVCMSLSPKEICRTVLLANGYYFYVLHNHPNDTIKPSEEDEIFTEELERCSRKFGFVLLDHLIIGRSGYYSLLNKL